MIRKTITALVIPAIGLGMAMSAGADQPNSPAYLSLGYGQHEHDDRFFDGSDFDTGDLIAKLGGQVNAWFSVEMRAGVTVSDHSDDLAGYPGLDSDYSLDYFYGGYLKFGWANSSALTPYVIGGYTEGRERLENRYGKYTNTFHDVSYGAGVDLSVNRRVGVNLEYMVYHDKDDLAVKGPSASLVWKF